MQDETFIFGVDLDGVCADFYGKMREIAAEWMSVPIDSLPVEVKYGLPEWNLDQFGGYEDLHRFAVTQRNLFKVLIPIEGAAVTLRRLSRQKIRIRIITHRLFIKHFHQTAIQQTIEWLDYNGFPYWDLCFMKDKGAVGANIYIDDSPGNVQKLRSQNHFTIVYTNSTNRDLSEPRANSWLDVEAIVLGEYEKWTLKNSL